MSERWVSMGVAIALATSASAAGAAPAVGTSSTATTTAAIGEVTPPPTPQTSAPSLTPSATAPIFEKGTPLEWRWAEFDTLDWIFTGVALGFGASSYAFRSGDAKRQGGVLLDEEAREAIRLPTYHQRQVARDTSDVMVSLMTSFPFLVDSLIITYWHRSSGQAAWQMALIDVQAIAITASLQGVTSALAGRERPYGRTCGNELSLETKDCENFNRNASFFSGHTSLAFTLAGLVCSHHSHLAINGDPFDDALPCAGMMVAASGVGLLRMLGDMHYLSDVLTGAAVGTLVGLGVPWLFHYRHEIEGQTDLSIQLVPSPNGAALMGTF